MTGFCVMCLSAVLAELCFIFFLFLILYINRMNALYCLSCLLDNKVPDFLFHLKNGKGNESGERKVLHYSNSYLKKTGIRKFLTIKRPFA